MQNSSLWHSTLKLYIVGISYFVLSSIVALNKAPPILLGKVVFFLLSIFGLLTLLSKKLSVRDTCWLYIMEVIFIVVSIEVNHQYYVVNALRFQPYISIKLLAVFIALTGPSISWATWTSIGTTAAMLLIQYFSWPAIYKSQLGIQEPVLTICFVIVAGAIYLNRMHLQELLKKETVIAEKVTILTRLKRLVTGLQHLNNTPLQTMGLSIQLLRERHPDSEPIIEALERAYQSVVRVNHLMGLCGSSNIDKSASTVRELEQDLKDIGQYLKS
jgi:hypothetical protein